MKSLRNNPNQKYVCFDTETESLNLQNSRPWEVAFVVFDQKKTIEKVNLTLRWEDINISKGAKEVTGFNEKDYFNKAKDDPKESFSYVEKYLYSGDYIVVGQNILGFDIYQIANWAKAIGKPVNWKYLDWCIDTLALAKAIKSNREANLENFLGWQFAMLNTRVSARCTLGQLASDYEIEKDEDRLHEAMYDTEINAKVFVQQLYDIEI